MTMMNDRPDRAASEQAETSRATVASPLRSLGVKAGAVLVVHASFSRVGPVEGGPLGLIGALREVLGPNGTLVMPSMADDDEHVFDPAHSPCRGMGVVADVFWRQPGVLRSDSPHAFAAIGPHAAALTAPHPVEVPHGDDSPPARAAALDGQVLLLGVGHDADTTIHVAENRAGVRYRLPTHAMVLRQGRPTRVDYGEVDHCCGGFAMMDAWLEGRQARGVVGRAEARLALGRDILTAALAHLAADETVFLHPAGADAECDAARASLLGPTFSGLLDDSRQQIVPRAAAKIDQHFPFRWCVIGMIATSQQAVAAQLLRHEGWTRRLARTLTSDDALADDIAQDTWVSALRRPPQIRAPLRPWLRKVVRHNLFNRSRLGRRREARERAAGLPPDPVSPEELVGRGEIHRLLVETVMALKEPYRQVVVMRYFDGLTSAQIALRTNVPPATVRGRFKTALDLLRASLDVRRGGRRDWLEAVRDLFDPTSGPPEAAPSAPSSPGAGAHPEGLTGNGSRPPATAASRPAAPRVLPARALPAKAVVLTIVLGAAAIPAARHIASWNHPAVPADPTTEGARVDEGAKAPGGETEMDEGGPGPERLARPRAAVDPRGGATPGAVSRTAERNAIAMAATAGDGRVVPFSFKGIVGRVRSGWQALAARATPGGLPPDRDIGLANVVVKIVAGPGAPPGAPPPATTPAVLRLGPAGFAPRVSVARVDQAIAVENADDVPHLLEVLQDSTVLFKGSLPSAPTAQRVAVAAEGTVIKLTLATRPKTVAFVVTADNSFHAITDGQGRFFLEGVPAGAYVLEAWHELSGVTRTPVEVSPAGRGEVEIVMDQALSAARHGLCQIAGHRATPVSEACRVGGIAAARKTMKRLVSESHRRGGTFRCEGCHVDLDGYRLREGAEAKLVELLRLTGP